MNISIVIPLFNEDESLTELTDWINRVMEKHDFSYEIIYIDDGSTDKSWQVIEELATANNQIRGIKFRRNYGKSAALQKGFEAAQGEVVITMDADLQDSPDEIPELYRMIAQDKYDLVSGWKRKRYDPLMKTIPSKLFNKTTQLMSGIYNLHDFNCGLKAYRQEVVKNIEVYGEMHRYIPVIAKWQGFSKIAEKEVQHQARKYGVTKFGLERFINGFLDLLTIFFVGKFGKRPMHMFGTLGTLMFAIGFMFTLMLGLNKLYTVYFTNENARMLTERPSFYLSLTCMVLGSMLFLAGFLGELISRVGANRNNYQIEKRIK
ncbi:MAG: glycosyltransferase family 2 protein [Bacteroidetes bacterium]|nr:glycosyltransferase family 2 protein [Bacteroidota bacterium]